MLPLPPTAASSHDGQILTASPPNVNVQMSPDVDVLDALPNPWFQSHAAHLYESVEKGAGIGRGAEESGI